MELKRPLPNLPDDALRTVFSHLEMKKRLEFCLVCKKWLELMNCRDLLIDITVNIKSSTFEDYAYQCMTRNFLNFDILEMSTDDNSENGLNYIGPRVEFLGLGSYEPDRHLVFSLDTTFQHLKTLDAFTGNTWDVFPSCPNLIQLTIYKDEFTDAFIAVLQKTMKRLKVFKLYNPVVDDPSKYRKYYPPGVTYEENPSSKVLSFPAIKSFVLERVSTLSEIDMRENSLSVSTLTELLSLEGLNLATLFLYTEEKISPASSQLFISLFRNHGNLKILNISGFDLADDVNETFCEFLPNIEELEITCKLTDKFLKDILSLKKLEKLGIFACTGFSASGCREAISSFKSNNITDLTLHNFYLPVDRALVFKEWTHLVELDLSLSLAADPHVHVISTYLVNLEYLNLSENPCITDYGLAAVLCSEKNENSIGVTITVVYKALYNLKRLLKLDLSWCTQLTGEGLIAAIRFPLLHTLMLYGFNFPEATLSMICSQNSKFLKLYNIKDDDDD